MRAPFVLAMLLALSPLALADFTQSGVMPLGLDAPYTAQGYCTIVQTAPASATNPAVCQAHALPVRGVNLLRLRIQGEGHALAWAFKDIGGGVHKQFGPIECAARPDAPSVVKALEGRVETPVAASCSLVVAPFGTVSGPMDLHLRADGPGRAVFSATLEYVLVQLP